VAPPSKVVCHSQGEQEPHAFSTAYREHLPAARPPGLHRLSRSSPGDRWAPGTHSYSRRAHFHADYGEYGITVTIEEGVVEGHFPRRALRHVLEWYELHREELQENWERARRREPLVAIAPLE
jgi:hypothetical protein